MAATGLDARLGRRLVLDEIFDLSLYRASFQEDFEIASKLLLVEQAPRLPITVSLRVGTDLLRRPGVQDSGRPFFLFKMNPQFGSAAGIIARADTQ